MKNGLRRLRVAVARLPKNARSNRYWVFWGGTLYFSKFANAAARPRTLADFHMYVRWSKYLNWGAASPSRSAIYVTELGMFGNMTRRFANGLLASSLENFGGLIVPSNVIFEGRVFRRGIHRQENLPSIYFGEEPMAKQNATEVLIRGNLFSEIAINEIHESEEIDRVWERMHSMLRKLPSTKPKTERHLTIHLRGGDVFGPRKPRAYGQPPLSYYEFVLNLEPWEEVTVVHEGKSNPVLPGLEELCHSRGIRVRLINGSLEHDIAVLLEATCLVAGRGTFVPAIAGLSRNCKKLFYFEDKCKLVPRPSGIKLIRVFDARGIYRQGLLSNNWENSIEQREMMLNYSISNLSLGDA